MFGENYLENFKTNQINTDHVFVTDQASTGVAPIFVDEKG
jgi:sugar/nucleoside kinase (ribokinase family)